MPVGVMLRQMSARELSEWAAYEKISGPLGAPRADLQAGIISAAMANTMGNKLSPADFIPEWDRTPPSAEELFKKVVLFNAALGGEKREG